MLTALPIKTGLIRGLSVLGAAFIACGTPAAAQQATTPAPQSAPDDGWQRYDWLNSSDNAKDKSAVEGTVKTSDGQDIKDPFSVLTTGALWQEKSGYHLHAECGRFLDDVLPDEFHDAQ